MTEIGIQLQNGHSGVSHLRRNSFGKTACHCCPYGYHIDLDFVRFCETMAKDGAEQSPTKRQRKERRRQRQSMEVLLGLTNPVIWNIEHLLPPVSFLQILKFRKVLYRFPFDFRSRKNLLRLPVTLLLFLRSTCPLRLTAARVLRKPFSILRRLWKGLPRRDRRIPPEVSKTRTKNPEFPTIFYELCLI